MSIRPLAALAALVVLVVACTAGPGTGGTLEGTTWVLRSYDDGGTLVIVPETQYADAHFSAKRVEGFAGCNDYDAIARQNGRTLLISQAAVTQKACSEDANAFEATYLGLLQQSRLYGARADTLTIFGDGGQTILVFDAAPKNPLLGAWNVDSYSSAPGTDVVPIEGTVLTAVFAIANVGGSSGCNTYDGTYGTNGTVVKVGRLATTRLACADDIMSQETAFLTALEGAAIVERRGRSLILRDRNDNILVAMTKPGDAAEATAPTPSEVPAATAKPTTKPSPSATARPTATPTARPTAAPTAAPTPAPTVAPPESVPPEADCALTVPGNVTLATIVYPAAWFTVTTPASVACRYFDPTEITVPSDPSTLETAVTIVIGIGSYQAAVADATDPASWDVIQAKPVTISALPAILVEATSTASGGATSYSYIIDYGDGGTVTIATTGTLGSTAYETNTSVVDLIAAESTFTPVS